MNHVIDWRPHVVTRVTVTSYRSYALLACMLLLMSCASAHTSTLEVSRRMSVGGEIVSNVTTGPTLPPYAHAPACPPTQGLSLSFPLTLRSRHVISVHANLMRCGIWYAVPGSARGGAMGAATHWVCGVSQRAFDGVWYVFGKEQGLR